MWRRSSPTRLQPSDRSQQRNVPNGHVLPISDSQADGCGHERALRCSHASSSSFSVRGSTPARSLAASGPARGYPARKGCNCASVSVGCVSWKLWPPGIGAPVTVVPRSFQMPITSYMRPIAPFCAHSTCSGQAIFLS